MELASVVEWNLKDAAMLVVTRGDGGKRDGGRDDDGGDGGNS